jgi:hypothetical protein
MKNQMKPTLLGLVCLALLAGPAIASADSIYDWTFTGGGVTASGTLDVSGGQAVSGTGTIAGGGLSGSESLTLVTLSTPGVNNLGGGNLSYRFGGGTDLIGDTVYNSSAPYVDSNGLVFLVGGPGSTGFNLWSTGATSYTGFLASTSLYEGVGGTMTSTPVPLPAALPLFLFGVAALGALGRRRKLAILAPA